MGNYKNKHFKVLIFTIDYLIWFLLFSLILLLRLLLQIDDLHGLVKNNLILMVYVLKLLLVSIKRSTTSTAI